MFIDGLTLAGILSSIPILLFVLVFGRTIPEEIEEHRTTDRIGELDCCAADR